MRKVKFNKFIPALWEIVSPNTYKTLVKGTSEYEKDFPNEGLFHSWGVAADGEGGTDTIAIVELEDGTIESPYLKDIKFIK